jgi:hypothetical protein
MPLMTMSWMLCQYSRCGQVSSEKHDRLQRPERVREGVTQRVGARHRGGCLPGSVRIPHGRHPESEVR